jgi:hypothetical protein
MPADPPYRAYAAILGTFAGALAGTAVLERELDRETGRWTPLELVLLSAATFKAARAISRERVGSVLREPFVETEGDAPDGAVEERPVGEGLQRAIGELVTCTRCAGTWAAAGLIATRTLSPRFGRLLTWSLAAGAANDFLQAGFAAICGRADASRNDG